MPTDPIEEKILNRIPWAVLITAAVFGILAVFVFDPLTGLIFFAGGALAALGFIWLKTLPDPGSPQGQSRGPPLGDPVLCPPARLASRRFFNYNLYLSEEDFGVRRGLFDGHPGLPGGSGPGPRPNEDNGRTRTQPRRRRAVQQASSAVRWPRFSPWSAFTSKTRPAASPIISSWSSSSPSS